MSNASQDHLRAELATLERAWRERDLFAGLNAHNERMQAADRRAAWARWGPRTPKLGRLRKPPADIDARPADRFWRALGKAPDGETAGEWLQRRATRRVALLGALYRRERDAFEARRDALLTAIVPRVGPRWHAVDERSTTDYPTQTDRRGYAHASAEQRADALRAAGIPVFVLPATAAWPRTGTDVRRALVPPQTFVVNAQCEPVDYRAALAKPADLVEWVRSCWARGVNPRVYNPFLPHGFEERHGLDYQGRRKEATP